MTISSTGGCTHSASGDDANKTEEEKFSVGSESDVYMRTNELSWEEFFLELPNDDDTVREQLAAEPRKLNEQKHSESSKTLLYVENEDHCIGGFNGSPSRPEDVQNERNVVLQNEDNIVLQLDSQDRQMATEDALQNVKSPIGTVEQSNSRSDASANKMRTLNTYTPQREQVTTKLSCSLEVLKQRFGMKIDDAADSLGISRSTLKSICRDNGIKVWPYRKRKKNIMNTIPHVTIPLQDANNSVTIKATYEDDIIKFKLPLSSRMDDLREKVGKRLNLEVGSFKIKHKDDDGDLVLITCDEDLQDCMSRSLNRTSLIDMLVVPLTNRSGFHNENAPLFV